jgi:hypothetical protein
MADDLDDVVELQALREAFLKAVPPHEGLELVGLMVMGIWQHQGPCDGVRCRQANGGMLQEVLTWPQDRTADLIEIAREI